jgi:hypothetical protein
VFSCWSADGEWLYFNTDRDDGCEVWRMRSDGGDAGPVGIAGIGVCSAQPDGEHLLHTRLEVGGLWKSSLSTGVSSCEVSGETVARWLAWEAVNEGIYYAIRDSGDVQIRFHRLADGTSVPVTRVARYGGGFSVSPDRRFLLYDHYRRSEGDLVLVRGFR